MCFKFVFSFLAPFRIRSSQAVFVSTKKNDLKIIYDTDMPNKQLHNSCLHLVGFHTAAIAAATQITRAQNVS